MRTLILFTFLLLIGCGKEEKSTEPLVLYPYGMQALPGELPLIDVDFEPAGLQDKTFSSGGKTFSPVDIVTEELKLSLDVATQKTSGRATIQFRSHRDAHPYLELKGTITLAELDGVAVDVLPLTDPDGLGLSFHAFDRFTAVGEHTLILEYELPESAVTYNSTGVNFITSMRDVSNVRFFEVWAPVAFEDDQFHLKLELELLNTAGTHQIFSNGEVLTNTPSNWTLEFPAFYTKSSFYIHLTNSTYVIRDIICEGIPVRVYSSSTQAANEAVAILPGLFREFIDDYGPFPHDRFLAFVQTSRGGMEYAGATVSSIGALDHELLHSWFARGVMPAEGRSGWIDEAIASWRDNGYFQAPSLLRRQPTNLSHYSAFRQSTPSNSYSDGRELLAELDRVFAGYGGLKPILRLFADTYRHRVVTNEELWLFLESMSMLDLDRYISRYTLAGNPVKL